MTLHPQAPGVPATATIETAAGSGIQPAPQLCILYDGGCPLCLREVRFLSQRDERLHTGEPRLAFVDINDPGYDPAAHAGVDYRAAMGRIHAIGADGVVLRDVAVFRRAYALVGLGWLYAPTRWPGLRWLANALYGLWARWRLRLTGRPSLEQLCNDRCRPLP
jgi:predicted DCC family thiol-disulfide oxidoreductase YuxK